MRNARPDQLPLDLQALLQTDSPLDPHERAQALQEMLGDEGQSPLLGAVLHRLLAEGCRLREGLQQAGRIHADLKEKLNRFLAPPLIPGVFVGYMGEGPARQAIVGVGQGRRVVNCSDDPGLAELQPGDEVLLSEPLNLIVARPAGVVMQVGETATFQRYSQGGRLLIATPGGMDVLVDAALGLRDQTLQPGDQVVWDRQSWMAFERLPRDPRVEFGLVAAPAVTFADIGGLDSTIAELQDLIAIPLTRPDLAAKYQLKSARSCLLVGGPGLGKTMIAQATANWISSVSPCGEALFGYIKPGSHRSMWYGESEGNIRRPFQLARQALVENPERPIILFQDELDSIGTHRGTSYGSAIDDRVMTSYLAELDGFEARARIFVLAASNRADLLDSALTRAGRLGDRIIEIPRPDSAGAAAILGKHLQAGDFYHHAGTPAAQGRDHLIASVVSRLYAPNGDSLLGTVKLRDGSERPVRAADLMNGASLANLAMRAKQAACLREARTAVAGIRLEDVLDAAQAEVESLWGKLSPRNCRHYLTDLPADLDVVSLTAQRRQVPRPHRVLRVA